MGEPTKKKRVAGKKNPLTLAVQVSDRVQILDVRLLGSSCQVNPVAFSEQHTAKFSHAVKTSLDDEAGIVNVVTKFAMRGFPEKGSATKPSAVIEATFLVIYQITDAEGLEQENFDNFGRFNGTYNAWPYWREFVQNMVLRMGLPQLVVPVFRISSSGKPTDKAITSDHTSVGEQNPAPTEAI